MEVTLTVRSCVRICIVMTVTVCCGVLSENQVSQKDVKFNVGDLNFEESAVWLETVSFCRIFRQGTRLLLPLLTVFPPLHLFLTSRHSSRNLFPEPR